MRIIRFFVILLIVVSYPITAFTYNDKETHRDLTEVSVQKSVLNNYLKNMLDIQKGLENTINGIDIARLIQDGSTNEDLGNRAYNHFYNPIWEPVTESGLDDSPFPLIWWGSATIIGKPSNCLSHLVTGIPDLMCTALERLVISHTAVCLHIKRGYNE